jgi:hypothetical protein
LNKAPWPTTGAFYAGQGARGITAVFAYLCEGARIVGDADAIVGPDWDANGGCGAERFVKKTTVVRAAASLFNAEAPITGIFGVMDGIGITSFALS